MENIRLTKNGIELIMLNLREELLDKLNYMIHLQEHRNGFKYEFNFEKFKII